MRFDPPLQPGVLRRRYKRFLADIEAPDGTVFTAHCPNTGSMRGCAEPGAACWTSTSTAKGRKYPQTLELVATGTGLVGVHTGRANALVAEALAAGLLPDVVGEVQPEVTLPATAGERRTRIDFRVATADGPVWIEVKSVTLGAVDVPGAPAGQALFPDAVSERARRHLDTLAALRAAGERAMLLYCVQRSGVTAVAPADGIDPAYGAALRAAAAAGVEVRALAADLGPEAIELVRPLPVALA